MGIGGIMTLLPDQASGWFMRKAMAKAKTKGTAIWAVVLALLLVAAFFVFYLQEEGAQKRETGIVISEVVSSNELSLADAQYGSPDWIELTNVTDAPMSLAGYSLARTDNNAVVYEFGHVTLQSGEYYVVYACEQIEGGAKPCTGFKLPKAGITLQLVAPSGTVLQELKLPALETDTSYGLDATGQYRVFSIPSPGKENGTATELAGLQGEADITLMISEILPYGRDEESTWVELYNYGGESVSLSGLFITDNPENPDKAAMPNRDLAPGEYLALDFSDSDAADALPFGINRRENTIGIYDLRGRLIHQLTWDTDLYSGYSAGEGQDGSVVYYHTPTKAAVNGHGSESFEPAEGYCDVIINEVLRDNAYSLIDQYGERAPWVELYNASASPVDLNSYYLSDDETRHDKWQLPAITLQPDEYLVVFLTGNDVKEGELHSSFRLGSADSVLTLTHSGMRQTVAIDQTSGENISYGRVADGSWLYFAQPTPAAENTTKGFVELDAAAREAGKKTVTINEVSAAKEARSERLDWVELYNSTSEELDLTGWVLSDSTDPAAGMALTGTLAPGGYLVTEGLKIASTGENLYLYDARGNLADSYRTGLMRPGYSTGINTLGVRTVYETPTKGKANGDSAILGYCAAPVFSRNGGYTEAAFALTITCATPGAVIYYTTDGSEPTTSSKVYSAPLSVEKNTCIKAVAKAENYLISDQTAATYYFTRHELPVVCLSLSESDLSYISSSLDRRDEMEREGYVEYYDADGSLGVAFPAGFRISGNSTRQYPQRSFNIYLRDGYGRGSVTYPFFGEEYEITKFTSLGLRNFGQDASNTLIRDAYASMAVNGMKIDNAQTILVAAYINGKYWGMYEFDENMNGDWFESKYGVDSDTVQGVRSNTYVYNGVGNNRDIKSLFALALKDTANESAYAEYAERADAEYFTDYIIARLFFSDGDVYNQKYMRTTDYTLKWRPVWYDLDMSFGGDSPSRNLFSTYFRTTVIEVGAVKEDGTRNFVDMGLYYGFYKNAQWREQFVVRAAEVLNTVLTTEKLLARFDEMYAAASTEIQRHVDRWGRPKSAASWNNAMEDLRECIAKRRDYVIDDLQDFFGVSDERMAELFPNG